MSLLTANSIPVSQAYISLPRVGRGVADLVLASDSGPRADDTVELTWQSGEKLRMTCFFAERSRGWWSMHCKLGAGGLERNLSSRYYEGIPAATVAKDILNEAGESAGQIDLPGTLIRYVRRAGPAYQQLFALLEGTGRAWRVQLDGKVWVGVDSYPTAGPLPVVQAYPEKQHYILPLQPDLQPGVALVGVVDGQERPLGRVERVVHRVGQELHTEVYCAT